MAGSSPVPPAWSEDDSHVRWILERAASRDQRAVATFHGLFHGRLTGFLRFLRVPRDRAEELASDVLFEACVSRAHIPADFSVAAAIARMAYSAVRSGVPGEPTPAAPDVRTLQPTERVLLGLVYVFGCSREDVARILGCSTAGVVVMLRQASATMRARPSQSRATRPCEDRP